jgi:hypothetical protein
VRLDVALLVRFLIGPVGYQLLRHVARLKPIVSESRSNSFVALWWRNDSPSGGFAERVVEDLNLGPEGREMRDCRS